MSQVRKSGFSLVEILIVVVTLGILASVVVPHFSNSGEVARHAATVEYLQGLRSQIDLYRNQHMGQCPGLAGADPDMIFVEQLTLPTNAAGDRSSNVDQGFGDPNFPFGPYIPNVLAPNPFNKSRRVRTVTRFPDSAPGGSNVNDPGWIYEITSGRVKINKVGVSPTGQAYWDL